MTTKQQDKIFKFFSSIPPKLPYLLLFATGMGGVIGYLVSQKYLLNLKPLITPLVFLTVFPALLAMKSHVDNYKHKTFFLIMLINIVFVPFVAILLAKCFMSSNPAIATGIVMMGLLPTSSMTIALTSATKGRVPVAIMVSLIGIVCGSLLSPFVIPIATGIKLSVSKIIIIRQVMIILILPLLLSIVGKYVHYKKTGETFPDIYRKPLMGLSSLSLFFMIFVATSLKAKTLLENPAIIGTTLVPVVLFYLIIVTFVIVLARKACDAGGAKAMIFTTIMRNLSISVALIMGAFGADASEAVLPITLAFIIQSQLGVFIAHHIDKIVKEPKEA